MQGNIDQKTETSRSETRRAQIHIAASKCFQQHGFHGTSIAQISKAAGMSVGHIYHYFENKEAIIADIVAKDTQHLLKMTSKLLLVSDIRATMMDRITDGIKTNLDANIAALQIEMVAEAARNPAIAKIIQTADQLMRDNLTQIIHLARQADGCEDSEEDILGMVETFAVMFEGLRVRAIRNPKLNQEALIKAFKRTILGMLLKTT